MPNSAGTLGGKHGSLYASVYIPSPGGGRSNGGGGVMVAGE